MSESEQSQEQANSREEFVRVAIELRNALDEAEDELMQHLYYGEQNKIHEGTGRTFLEFLAANNIVRAERYDAWKKTRDALGPEAISGVGINAVIVASRLKTNAEKVELLAEARRSEKSNGVKISEQTAKFISKQVKVRAAAARNSHHSYDSLADENDRLRSELESAKLREVSYKSEIKTLKTQMAALKAEYRRLAAGMKSKTKRRNEDRAEA